MTSAIRQSTDSISPLSQLYAPVALELEAVEAILRDELRSRYPYVDEIVRYGCLLGGKRLRPVLLLLAAQAAGGIVPAHRTLAAVVEMIHTATLVHDDVLDEADFRRHLPTVNSRWDNEASILLGDFLFTHAFYLASTVGTVEACQMIGRATNIVCEGELRQKGCEGDFTISERDYLEVIESKTAELCACSCRLGAHFAAATSGTVALLEAYGRDLGIAFQIADDLLDLVGDERVVGKSLGTDLNQLKPTLPVIRLLQTVDGAERARVLDLLRSDQENLRSAILPYLERSGAIGYARGKAREFAQRAAARLADLPDSEAAHVLRRLAEFVVNRGH